MKKRKWKKIVFPPPSDYVLLSFLDVQGPRRRSNSVVRGVLYVYMCNIVFISTSLWRTPKPPSIMWFSARRTHTVYARAHTRYISVVYVFPIFYTRARNGLRKNKKNIEWRNIFLCLVSLQFCFYNEIVISLFVVPRVRVYRLTSNSNQPRCSRLIFERLVVT